ncbi:MAG: hypothetical protein M0P23_00010 [Bacteroidales bacterium]|jgi:hypothetical protein|nr:hypothetical protein [Bacteroidales bacterium]MDY0174021.1 hypothetical protein [Bacteroidales bacterium]
MSYSNRLKERLITNAKKLCQEKSFTGEERKTAFLFDDISMSFNPDSYKNILENAEYKSRLDKVHPQASGFMEMQSSNSSDALLMNFFAHPRIKEWKSLRDLLLFFQSDEIEFGWNPLFENETTKTEVDMKIGNQIFEAKLTESDFTKKDLEVVLRYANVENIIDLKPFINENNEVINYQLIRNILAAEKYGYKFNLLVDETRTDLIREFYRVKMAIINKDLADQCNFYTWQEIAEAVGRDLKNYITDKYF